MEFLPDWAPGIHPLIIHFPIALITVAIAFDLLSLFKRDDKIKLFSVLLYFMGALGAIVSYITGKSAADSLIIGEGNYDIFPAISSHSDMASYSILFFSIYATIRIFIYIYGRNSKRYISLLVFLLGLVGFTLVAITAEKGAELVYRYGLGTQLFSKSAKNDKTEPEVSGFLMKENSSWEWQTQNNAASTLKEQFNLLNGDLNNLKIEDDKGILSIKLLKDESFFFIYNGDFSDIVLESTVNLDDFKGSFLLAHHVSDTTNFDFFELKKYKAFLGRKTDKASTVFDQIPFLNQRWLDLKAVGDNGHFRGYINNKLVVHGHGKDLDPGKVGFSFSGSGTISIKNLKTTSLADPGSQTSKNK